MKQKLSFVLAALLLALQLGGCQWLCRHDWNAATCEEPKTCRKCELTEGENLGHRWESATCEEPRTCSRCGNTRGFSKGHRWSEATCEEPRICSVCNKTQGKPKGHDWQEATTEAPRTCTDCGMTTGFAIDADERFTTAETAALQGTWATDFAVSGSMVGEPDFTGELKGRAYITFGNAGTLTVRLETQNMPEFEAAMLSYIKKRIYAELAAKGLGTGAADLAVQAAFGMTTDEYAQKLLQEIDVAGIIADVTKVRVYYAKDSTVYIADDWNSSFLSSTYRFENETLVFDELYINEASPLRWSPVAE